MSTPAIYIAPQGTTSHVTPRYTRTWIRPTAPQDAARGPRSHGAVFQDSHTPYGIRNSESQNRESGISESWCGRVGQTKRSCSKRSIPPFRSLHSIHPSNALLGPSQLQQSTSPIHHHKLSTSQSVEGFEKPQPQRGA